MVTTYQFGIGSKVLLRGFNLFGINVIEAIPRRNAIVSRKSLDWMPEDSRERIDHTGKKLLEFTECFW